MRLPQDRILHIDTEFEDGKVNVCMEWQGELVRCKDCRYKELDGETTHFYWCRINERPVDDDDFCTWGERKGGEDE